MRIVCISDTHGHHRDIDMPEGDILIHAGDITHFGKEHQLDDFNAWLGELGDLYSAKLVIAGNHECNNDSYCMKDKITNGIFLDSSSVVVKGVEIFGIGFFPHHYPATIPPTADIVISHNPPKDIGDSGGGSLGLLRDIKKRCPILHVFGHVHTGYGLYPPSSFNGTTFVNAAICGGKYGYACVNQPICVDIEKSLSPDLITT